MINKHSRQAKWMIDIENVERDKCANDNNLKLVAMKFIYLTQKLNLCRC